MRDTDTGRGRESEIRLSYCQSAVKRSKLLQGTAHHSHPPTCVYFVCLFLTLCRAGFHMYELVCAHSFSMNVCLDFCVNECMCSTVCTRLRPCTASVKTPVLVQRLQRAADPDLHYAAVSLTSPHLSFQM